jgi:glycosyltransferase involved in cell wall biosynthesis
MKLTIIIPCYNEAKYLGRILSRVLAADVLDFEREVIVVDDGSDDDSFKVICTFENQLKIIRHESNKGKGASIKSAMGIATGDIIIIQDADLEYSPEDYHLLLAPFLYSSRYNDVLVFGVRKKDNIKIRNCFSVYFYGGRILGHLINFCWKANIRDIHTCYKVFPRILYWKLDINSDRFSFCHELTIKALMQNVQFIEVEIEYCPRTKDEGKKINIWDGILCFILVMRLYFLKLKAPFISLKTEQR